MLTDDVRQHIPASLDCDQRPDAGREGPASIYPSIEAKRVCLSEEPGKAATCFDATTPNNRWIHVPRGPHI
jgi:hypothetical protein